ncbi:MAG TPA: hypothetical protein VGM94_00875 [Galbitalea sp.]
MTRLPARNIMLRRVEGSPHELGTWHARTWDAAESQIAVMRRTAPARGGYDKVLVLVTFETDETGTPYLYSTRYDIKHPDVTDSGDNLARHIRHDWEFKALRWTPAHMDRDKHRAFLLDLNIDPKVWATRCDRYDIPGLATLCAQCEANARWNEAAGCKALAEECRAYCRNGHKAVAS